MNKNSKISKKEKFQKKIQEIKELTNKYGNIKIIAATKYMSVEDTRLLVEAGIKDIGENRVDIFLEKYEALKDLDINWHFFGVVQSRKVKDVADKINYLHSLDKLSTAMEINNKIESPLDCFVQVNVTEEQNKEGIPVNRVKTFIKSLAKCENIRVVGLMCVASMTYDNEIIEKQFSKMQKLKQEIEEMNLDYAPCHELSMGMSNDFEIALKYGATIIRLGRIFLD